MSFAKNRAPSTVPSFEEMISACKKNNVQFMDGVMFMHSPRLGQSPRGFRRWQKCRRSSSALSSQFSFYSGEDFFRDNIRVNGALEPAGCLGDLGWYSIRFALWTLNWQLPRDVSRAESFRRRKTCPIVRPRRLIFPPNCFLTAAFPRAFIARSLPDASNGSTSAAKRLAAAAGFRPSVQQL